MKQKMIVGGIAAIMIPFVITGVIIYSQLSDSLMEMANDKSIHLSRNISQGIDSFFQSQLRLVASIAVDPDIILALKTEKYEIATQEINLIYKSIGIDECTLFLADKNGMSRVDARFSGTLGRDLSDRQYFIKAKNGVPNVSGPVVAKGDLDGTVIVVICTPVFEDDVFLGVCAMVVTTEYLSRIISQITMGEAGYAFLLDENGLVLVHPRPEFVLKANLFNLTATHALKEAAISGQGGLVSYDFFGKKKIASITQVKTTGWKAAYTQTREEIMAPMNRLLRYIAISGIVFAVLTTMIVIIISERISHPIEQMMETVSQVTLHSREIIVQMGLDRKIYSVNPAFEKIIGIKAEKLIGTTPSLENNGEILSSQIWATLESGSPWSGQLEFKNDGSADIVTLDVMIVPLRDHKGRIQGYMKIGRDVTNDLMFEKRMRQAQKLEAIGTLAGGIAHDFNNILSIIFGYAELSLLNSHDQNSSRKHIQKIILASERARELVTQILSFSRQEAVELLPVQLSTIIKEALKLLRASSPSFIKIKSEISSEASVMADPTQIHQVVMNLFTNAVHAIGDNSGSITLALEDFMVGHDFTKTHPGIGSGWHLLFRVTDTGSGMSQETMDHIFEPFFTTKSKKKGTGLGLSVVHAIVKKMNGIITVYSDPDKGSTFNVILPVIKDNVTDVDQNTDSIQYGSERIVLVDDESSIVFVMQSLLVSLGYQVTSFTDSSRALAKIQSNPDEFDLIITDYTMPGLTGMDMVKELRSQGIQIPAILMSGFLGEKRESAAKQAGITNLLNKPINTYQLGVSIRKALEE